MKGRPVWITDDITQEEVQAIFHANGFMVRARNGIISIERVPEFLRRDSTEKQAA